MSLTGIVEGAFEKASGLLYNSNREKRYYPIFKTPEIRVEGSARGFARISAKSIDSLLSYGGVVLGGKEYGKPQDIEMANAVKEKYLKFAEKEGRELGVHFGKEGLDYDGFAFLDLGRDTYAAHIEVNGKKILAVSKQNHLWLNDDVKRLEVFGHETIHHFNKDEKATDVDNYNGFVNLYDKAVGLIKETYRKVVENIGERLEAVHEYSG